ncbi:glycosyltransferase [Bacteroides ihuae]|uniref:glycosyltransferase n=1 Tax=Bacteroides ihuae TaxID=1852362 RepID=UPI0008DAF647|nr:glycosyltransferase [Bacteroides ihuae]
MKKKILFVQQNLKGGGAEKVLVDILNNFDYRTYDITLILIENSGIYANQVNSNVRVLSLIGENGMRLYGALKKKHLFSIIDIFLSKKLKKILDTESFDTIVSFMEGIGARCHSYIFNRAKRNITWVHIDLELKNWALSDFRSLEEQKLIYEKMDEVIFVSDGAKDAFNRLFHTSRNKIIYNLIDVKQIINKAEDGGVEHSKFTFCNVGRLAEQKRQDRIIEVARIFKEKSVPAEFWLVGTGALEEQYKESVRQSKLEDYVKFKGFQTNPYKFLNAADVFLLTSDSEGYPLVVCEALCLGKPIVSTDVTGPHEILNDGSGVLTPKDPKIIAETLLSLYSNPKMLNDLSIKAKDKCGIFNIKRTMLEIYSVL